MRLDWSNPKVTLVEAEEFFRSVIGEDYSGLTIGDGWLNIVTTSELVSAEAQATIDEWYYTINNKAREVYTQAEKNDKTLRTVCAFTVTDANGLARAVFKIPANGRKVAFGDAEFEHRAMGDYVRTINVEDLDRILAWGVAFSLDSSATEPMSDEAMRQITIAGYGNFPLYPILDYYIERDLVSSDLNEGTVHGGIAMTYQFGATEMQPIGGYGNLPGDMYMVLECQKATATAGEKCSFSIDWGEPNASV